MLTFKEYILEYTKEENILTGQLTGIKSGKNGKNYNRVHMRKNPNTVRKEYNHKDPLVDNIVQGKSNNIPLAGPKLLNLLASYGIDFTNGETKTLGNSGVSVQMIEDEKGKRGILTKKVNNGL